MKYLIFSSLLLLSSSTYTQNIVKWIGGTPGQETTWNEPRNWSNYKVPDVFSNVVIPDVSSTTRAYPRIENGLLVELNSIQIYSNANITVEQEAKVIIYEYHAGLENEHLDVHGVVIASFENYTEEGKVSLHKQTDTIPPGRFKINF